jgi:hypothetical protein
MATNLNQENITKVVTQLENQLEGHIKQTNDKLDILIDLTRQMATMQERQNRHTDDISRLEKVITDERNRTTMLYDKIDLKMSAMEVDRKTSIDRLFTKIDSMNLVQSTECINHQKESDEDIKHIKLAHKTLEDEFNAKKNFNNGVMWILGIVLIASQGLAYKWIDSSIADTKAMRASITQLATIDAENAQQIEIIQRQVREIKAGGIR